MGPAAIEIDELAKRYRGREVLRSVTLDVAPATVVGYLGANGAGKTTTIRILLGQLRADAGSARIDGLDCWRHRVEVHRRVGYLPGEFVADDTMTAAGYLGFLARLRGLAAGAGHGLAERFGLDLGRRIGTLSHGNRQKVGLVQAFMGDPSVVVLDEPTSGLDPLMQRVFVEVVGEARRAGRTVLLSSHILDEVGTAADRVAVLRDGCIVRTDRIEALRAAARRHVRLTLTSEVPPGLLDGVTGVARADAHGRELTVVVDGSMAPLFERLTPLGVESVATDRDELDELFAEYHGHTA